LQPNEKPPLRPVRTIVASRSVIVSSASSGEALSTTIARTPGAPASEDTQSRSVARLL
jgi:hypothetical protein